MRDIRYIYVTLLILCGFSIFLKAQTPTTYSVLNTAYDRATNSYYPLGSIDNYWFLTKIEDLVVPNNPASVINYPNAPTYVVPNVGNNVYTGIIANRSINANATTTSLGLKLITFRTYFNLPNLSTTNNRYSLSFKMSADDAVNDVKLNGTLKGQFLSSTYNNIPGITKPYLLNIPICDTDFVSGQNYIDVTIADAGGSVGFYGEVTLFEVTNPFNMQLTSSAVCNGLTATASTSLSTTLPNPQITYTWLNSSGVVSQTNNSASYINSISNLSNGNYTVIAQVTSSSGCVSTTTVSVNVNCSSVPLCSGNLGAPVFFEDFGSGISVYGPALPLGVTNYPYYMGVPINGIYCISATGNPSNTYGYVNASDHTGNLNGYMMVVNADYSHNEAYRKHVIGLCPNTTYVFSSYLANNNDLSSANDNCGASYIYANVKFQVEYPLGVIQNSVTTGNLPIAPTNSAYLWNQYGFSFTTLSGQTTADIVLINNAPGGCGNDYVVDDISLSPCGPGVALSIVPNQTIFCVGDAISLQSNYTSGSYVNPQYQWQFSNDGGSTWNNIPGATSQNYNIPSASASQGGIYQLLVAENGNINISSCSIIAGPISFSVSNGISVSSSSTICSGSSATITASGSNNYSWSNGATTNSITVAPSTTTIYTVTGSVGSCTSQAVTTVSVIPSLSISVSGNTVICPGQSTTLTANGASGYIWSSGITSSSLIVSPNVTSSYSVSATGSVCVNTSVITVSVLATPTISVSSNTSICSGINASATLTVSGAGSYIWANSQTLSSSTATVVVASPSTTTIYTVTGTTSICSNTAAVTVSVNPSPIINTTLINNTFCGLNNGSATITSTPSNNTYSWSPGVLSTTNTAGSLAAGNYTVLAIDGICQTSTVVTILSSTPLLITSSTVIPSDCNVNNGSIVVTDNFSNSSYSWNPNVTSTNSAINLVPGIYSLTIINGACNTSTIFTVTRLNGPTALNINQSSAICQSSNGSISIINVVNGQGPYQYNFNDSGFSSITTYSNLTVGSYSIIVKDANSCLYTQTLTIGQITINAVLDLITNAPNCLSQDGKFIINNISGGTAPYLTEFNQTGLTSNLIFDNLSSGNYTLNIVDSNRCETNFILTMPPNDGDYTLYIPNTFTPNHDSVNDVWYIQGTCLGAIKCLIYNRWGEKIHEITDIANGWDGTYKGVGVPDGVYVYVLEVETTTGVIDKAGHITLFR